MKKKLLSLFLAVLTVVMALPVVLMPVAAAEEEVFDYTDLYVKNGLSFAVDFFETADHLNTEGYDYAALTNWVATAPEAWENGSQNVLNRFFHVRTSHGFGGFSWIKNNNALPHWTLGKGFLQFDADSSIASNNYINISGVDQTQLFTVQYIFKPGSVNQKTPFIIQDNRYSVETSGTTVSIVKILGRDNKSALHDLAAIPSGTVSYEVGALTDLTLTVNHGAKESASNAAEKYTHQFFVNGDLKYQLFSTKIGEVALAASTSVIGFSNATDMQLYAMRYYNRVLSEAEIAQNHLADLAGWFELDISKYAVLQDSDKQAVALYFKEDTFESTNKNALQTKLNTTILSVVYDVLMDEDDSAAAAAFTQTAKDYALDIATLRALPLNHRPAVYAAVAAAVAEGGATSLSLQTVINDTINSILRENYGDYIVTSTTDYKEFYVKQDNMTLWIDFFDAKPEDGKVYIDYSTEDYPDAYNYANWTFYYERQAAGDTNAATYRSKALIWAYVAPTACKNAFEAYYAVKNDPDASDKDKEDALASIIEQINVPRSLKDNREVTDRSADTSEEDMYKKYLIKGTSSQFWLYDIQGEVGYPHTNVREYGEGKLICGYNNSIGVKSPGYDSDLTYQLIVGYNSENPVADPKNSSGSTTTTPNMQLDGFRLSTRYTGSGQVTYSSLLYYGYGVTWRNELSTGALITHKDYLGNSATAVVPYTSAVDLTISMDKGIGEDDPHYYMVTEDPNKLHAQNGKPTITCTEVDPLKENYNDGPYVNYGRLSMMVYTNGKVGFDGTNITYNKNDVGSFGNTGNISVYAVRIYNIALTLPEVHQNHFADLVGYYDLDLTLYNLLPNTKKAALYEKVASIQLGGDRDAAVAAFEAALYELLYAFETETPAGQNFKEICKAVGLDVTSISALSPLSQERVFAQFADIDPTVPQLAPILQAKLEAVVAEVVQNYYGESLVHTIADFEGWQLARYGIPGFRGLYSFNEEALASITGKGIQVTVGLLVGDKTGGRTQEDMTVGIDTDGNIVAVDPGVTNKVFYSSAGYDEDCITVGTTEAPEYLFTVDTLVESKARYETETFYVAYVVLEQEGADDVIYYIPASLGGKTGAQSVASLSKTALEDHGWAYSTIHQVYNEVYDDELTTVYAGGVILSEYTFVKSATNALYIDQLQNIFEYVTGVKLNVINEADVTADMKNLIYVGKVDNIYGSQYYGVAAQIGNLYFWYNEGSSAEYMVDMAEELFDYYLDFGLEGFDIPDGTDLVRKR